ncbi:MAG: PhzF family phenazine biosynthesis protein [Candidatus Saccharibacteria bacterium]|nr:PhzF family phenazine biosynthesis protein [Candidatus Saccharibacteria bacterium]
MADVYIVSVGINNDGQFGDSVPIIIDENRAIPDNERQALAVELQAPETVFINSKTDADISIMHSQGEVDFAGVPALAAAHFLAGIKQDPVTVIKSRGGNIRVTFEDDKVWVAAKLDKMPPWNLQQLAGAADVEAIQIGDTSQWEHTMVWAWLDEDKGRVRSRTFANDWNIPEAPANGSGSMLLAAKLNKKVEIIHGVGTVLYARPIDEWNAEIGAHVSSSS